MLLPLLLSCYCLASSAFQFTTFKPHITTERDLKRDLFNGYDKDVRPVLHPAEQIAAYATLKPVTLRQLDEKNQVMVLETMMVMRWKDDFLKWNPLDYGNITELRVPPSLVWKPDLANYGASPESSLFPSSTTNVIIYSTGDVLWVPYFTISSRCPMTKSSEKNYLTCSVAIGSWTYSGPLLDPQLSIPEVDVSDFLDINPDWKLLGAKSNRVPKVYPCCPEEYPVLFFNFTLKRRSPPKSESWKPIQLDN